MGSLWGLIAAFVFQLPVMNGEPGEIYDSLKKPNQVRVIEAYFNNCPYCHDNAPQVDALAEMFHVEQRVEVLDVGVDRKQSDYDAWIKKHRPNHLVLKDDGRKLIGYLGTKSYPSTYVMDCEGIVTYRTSGVWSSGTKKKIVEAVAEALKKECE